MQCIENVISQVRGPQLHGLVEPVVIQQVLLIDGHVLDAAGDTDLGVVATARLGCELHVCRGEVVSQDFFYVSAFLGVGEHGIVLFILHNLLFSMPVLFARCHC